ncbi:MAG TPA: peptidylprolyl isomerase [Gemmatimonadota bacterium]
MIRTLLAAAAALALPALAAAQTVASERIVAVVGGEALLLSELEEQTILAASGAGVPTDDPDAMAALRRDVLERMVSDLVVVAAAAADDSIEVSESEVSEAVEAELDQVRGRFASTAEFERELARSQWRTLENYRRNLRRVKRRELLAQQYLAKHAARIRPVTVTDEQVRSYFEEQRGRLGTKPVTVRIRELDVLVKPTSEERERARAVADSLVTELRNGADFAELAGEFSGDPASAERGGDLGYFRRGVMVPAFEDAAFAIDSVGGLVGPVESRFGWHVIRLDDRQGDEIKARHILVVPRTSEADQAAARALAGALADSLAAGASFAELQERYTEATPEERDVAEVPLNALPEEWQQALRDLPVGGTTGALPAAGGFAILRLEGRGGGEPWTFEEIAPRLRSQLAQTLGQREFVEDLRRDLYVMVRPVGEAVTGPRPAGVAPSAAEPAALDTTAYEPPEPVTGPSEPGAAEAYTPDVETEPPVPVDPLDAPPPVADVPPPETDPSRQPADPSAPPAGRPDDADDADDADDGDAAADGPADAVPAADEGAPSSGAGAGAGAPSDTVTTPDAPR